MCVFLKCARVHLLAKYNLVFNQTSTWQWIRDWLTEGWRCTRNASKVWSLGEEEKPSGCIVQRRDLQGNENTFGKWNSTLKVKAQFIVYVVICILATLTCAFSCVCSRQWLDSLKPGVLQAVARAAISLQVKEKADPKSVGILPLPNDRTFSSPHHRRTSLHSYTLTLSCVLTANLWRQARLRLSTSFQQLLFCLVLVHREGRLSGEYWVNSGYLYLKTISQAQIVPRPWLGYYQWRTVY